MSATYEESTMGLLAHTYPIDEKWAMNQDDLVNSNQCAEPGRRCCRRSSNGQRRNAFVKGGMIGLIVSLLALVSFLVMAVFCPGVHSLLKRQNSGNTNNGNTFTNEHLWIIIVCVVGVIICIGLAICLASCCCREAFRNPLCCPCYTCACCGCLALLECIGCGLCCEGISQM